MNLYKLLKKASKSRFFFVLTIQTLGIFLLFAKQIILSNFLGSEIYGEFIYLLTFITIFSIFSKVGMDHGSMKFIPPLQEQKKYSECAGFMRFASKTVLTVSAIFAIIVVVIAAPHFSGTSSRCALPLLALIMLIQPQILIQGEFIKSLGLSRLSGIGEKILNPISVCLLIYMSLVLPGINKGIDDFSFVLLVIALSSAFSFWVVRRKLKSIRTDLYSANVNTNNQTEWLKYGVPFLLITSVQLINNHIDRIMIGNMINYESVGVYFILLQITAIGSIASYTVYTVTVPDISVAISNKDTRTLQKIISRSQRLSLMICLPLVSLLFFVYDDVVAYMDGDFSEINTVIIVLLLRQVVECIFGLVNGILNMAGFQKYYIISTLLSVIINLTFNFILIPTWGLLGAALASLVSSVFRNLFCYTVITIKLKINTLKIA